jgi:TIR domain
VRDGELLFSKYDLQAILELQLKKATEAARSSPAASVSPATEPSTLAALVEEFRVEPLQLDLEAATAAVEDVKVDVRHDPMRFVRDRSRPALVDGKRVSYQIPFKGDRNLWHTRPNQFTYNPPAVSRITASDIFLDFSVPGSDIATIRPRFEAEVAKIQDWIRLSTSDVDGFNQKLGPALTTAIASRRDDLRKVEAQIGSLGVPIRARAAPPAIVKSPRPAPKQSRRRSPKATHYEVALSFAGENRAYVKRVAELLQARGTSVFYDEYETVDMWGRNLVDHLSDVYGNRARYVVMFASSHYASKAWPTLERQSAQARAIKDKNPLILPARFDDTDIPGLPATTAYVDLRSLSPEQLVELIVSKLERA